MSKQTVENMPEVQNYTLIDLFDNINQLENRRIVYQNAIKEVRQNIKNTSQQYSWNALPPSPKKPEILHIEKIPSLFFTYCFFLIIAAGLLFALAKEKVDLSFMLGSGNKRALLIIFLIVFLIPALIAGLLTGRKVLKTKKAYNNEQEKYQKECDEVRAYNQEQMRNAEEAAATLSTQKMPDLMKWQGYIGKINDRLRFLYNLSAIPQKYQNAVAISFFVSYLKNERCDTLKECMNKYDDDIIYYQLKDEIAALYDRICQMEQHLTRELREFRSSIESDIRATQILVENNSSAIERTSYDKKTNDLLIMAQFL